MVNIKLLFREDMEIITNKLKKEGKNIWSISRLNNFNTCPRQYYYTYIEKLQQKQGIYSMLGTALHSDYEDLYTGVTDKLTPNNFNNEWMKAELFSINFPSENIKNNYKKDINTCYKYYQKMDGKRFISELGFLLPIDDDNIILGYIDLIEFVDDTTVKIYDFKSSAMFKDKKLKEAGRQLAIYQMALEKLYNLRVISNAWIMAKYVDIQVGNNKPMLAVQNKDIVKKVEKQIKKLMIKEGMDESIVEMYFNMCLLNNDLDDLPSEILNKIKIKTHIKPYEITDEVKTETLKYIKETIFEIKDIEKGNENNWECRVNKFFCENLCGFGNTYCKFKNMIVN